MACINQFFTDWLSGLKWEDWLRDSRGMGTLISYRLESKLSRNQTFSTLGKSRLFFKFYFINRFQTPRDYIEDFTATLKWESVDLFLDHSWPCHLGYCQNGKQIILNR